MSGLNHFQELCIELVQTNNFFDMSLDPSFTPLRQSNLAKFVTMQVNKVYKRLRLRNDVKYRENLFLKIFDISASPPF